MINGLSLNGTLVGPWQTVVNFDIGVPIEGPAEDFTVLLVFLKLFQSNLWACGFSRGRLSVCDS